jgi:rRNA maturation endonuclease Nob1
VGRDDWKYDEDAWDEMENEEVKAVSSPEKQCLHCLHWVVREAAYCPWCGKPLGEKGRKR